MSHPPRLLSITIALLAVASLLSGCGGAEGPAPTRLSATAGTPASEQVGPSQGLLERVIDDSSPPARLSQDVSILDSVDASYSAVPGATMLDANLDTLELDDDPFDRMTTRTLDTGDSVFSTASLEGDFNGLDTPSFDAAMSAEEKYGSPLGTDPMLDDPELDDPGFEEDIDPMLDDPMMDEPELDDPGMGW